MRVRLPEDPSRRRFVIGIGCSIALHLLLVLAMFLGGGGFAAPVYVKRGEPLMVDIAPERKEPAPLGRPDRPVGPPERQEPERRQEQQAPKPTPAAKPTPPPSKAAQARAAVEAQKPAPARQPVEPKPPTPPQQVAKAPAAESSPAGAAPGPQPAQTTPPQKPPEAAQSAQRPSERSADPQKPSEASPQGGRQQPEVSDPRFALAKPSLDTPPSIFNRRPGGGGGLKGGGRGGTEGEPIPLDTPDPKYQDYFNQVRERIKAKWIYPHEAGERGIGGNLMIEFHIGKDGRLSHLELRRSSGVEILDDYALRAIQLAQPFPPVPDTLAKNVLAISGLFSYQIIGNSFVNQYLR